MPSWSCLEALLKSSWSRLEAVLKPPWSRLMAVLKPSFSSSYNCKEAPSLTYTFLLASFPQQCIQPCQSSLHDQYVSSRSCRVKFHKPYHHSSHFQCNIIHTETHIQFSWMRKTCSLLVQTKYCQLRNPREKQQLSCLHLEYVIISKKD